MKQQAAEQPVMKTYAMSARVLGMPVMCGTIDATDAAAARCAWEDQFWSDPDKLRADAKSMDELNRHHAEKLLAAMDGTRAEARQYGLVVTARLSKARVPA